MASYQSSVQNSNSGKEILQRDAVDLQTQEISRWNPKLAPYKEGRERPKKEAGHSILAGGSFSKQGTYKACLGQPQDQ